MSQIIHINFHLASAVAGLRDARTFAQVAPNLLVRIVRVLLVNLYKIRRAQ